MMEHFPKPVVVISKCLGFEHCRYDGEMIDAPFVDKLKAHVLFFPVCPEVEIGLGVPRKPIRIVRVDDVNTLYQPGSIRGVVAHEYGHLLWQDQQGRKHPEPG